MQVLRLQDMGRHGVLGLVSFEGTRRGENDEEEKVSQPLAHWLSFREEKLSAITALPAEVAERRREVRG